MTLDEFIDSRSPGLDVVRLLLAMAVLVSHSWTLGGFGPEPGSPLAPRYLTLGGFAVAGFFALSGLLVGRSALRRTPAQYTRARLARIVPGYWVALVVSALLFAPIGFAHDHGSLSGFINFDPAGPISYVGRAALFPIEFFHGVADVFQTSTPYGRATGTSFVNGSLWTLAYEMRCYLLIGLLALAARRFGGRLTITVAWIVVGMIAVSYWAGPEQTRFVLGPVADPTMVMFAFIFLAGTLAGVWGHRIRLFGIVPLLALVLALVAGRTSLTASEHLGGATLAVLLPPLAAILTPIGARLRGIDLSYGLYLYAWPVQQLIAMYDVAPGPWRFVGLSTVATAGFAAASWFIVEHPAMKRARRERRPRSLPGDEARSPVDTGRLEGIG
jgi:peptidoglycan/LPS O-acetylase OafA/YrhL